MRTLVALSLSAIVAAVPAFAADVTLTTSDGVSLHAQTWGSGAKGVVLVHGAGRDVDDWSYFGDRLEQRGFHVIAVDLRGHGQSSEPATLTDEDYPKMVADIAAASAWLRANGATEIHLLGAELGANLVVHAGAADTGVTDIALLSAGMNRNGVSTPSTLETYGGRAVLIVTGEDDQYGSRSASVLEGKAQGPAYTEYLTGDAVGHLLINRDPQLEGKLVSWFNGTYDVAGQTSARQVTTQQDSDVETSGVRFGQ